MHITANASKHNTRQAAEMSASSNKKSQVVADQCAERAPVDPCHGGVSRKQAMNDTLVQASQQQILMG
jgi:hypothetical protein